MATVQRRFEKFKLSCPVLFDQPLAEMTTFQVGGPADILARPRSVAELQEVLLAAGEAEIPTTVLGGGANIVVSDRGIRGLVVWLGDLNRINLSEGGVVAGAGADISAVAAFAADHERSGLEFIYAMPGSTGGAVWMNARCYGGEIAPLLDQVEYVDRSGAAGVYVPRAEDFAYKVSPFQDGQRLITAVSFRLQPAPGCREQMWAEMLAHEEDRRAKGHFTYPCAGSIFKNDRRFGQPSGRIIDELGLRGRQRGAARVSDQHGNIIVNTGAARAADIRELTLEIRDVVRERTGFELEPEVLFIGDWH